MNKKYLFFALLLSNFCNHYSFTMDNQALSEIRAAMNDLAIGKNKAKYMAKKDAYDALFYAAVKGNIDKVKSLLTEYKLDPNIQNLDKKDSLLHEAVRLNRYDMAKYLIDMGANINTTPNSLETAMTYNHSEYDVNVKIVQLLIENKANLRHINPESGETLLHMAINHRGCFYATENQKAKVKYFIEQLLTQLEPNDALKIIQAKNRAGNTAAYYAQEYSTELYTLLEEAEKKAQEKTNATKTN